MRSEPLGSTDQPSQGDSVTRLPPLLGHASTDPEVLKETEGTQLSGQMELLKSPILGTWKPACSLPLIGLLSRFFVSLWEMITGSRVPANHCHQPRAPGRPGRYRWSVWTAVQGGRGGSPATS